MKRRTRKQWYKYHLLRSQQRANAPVVARFAPLIQAVERELIVARERLRNAERGAPALSRIAGFLGFTTEYHARVVEPLVQKLRQDAIALSELRASERRELDRAGGEGADTYKAFHALRKHQATARARRAVERRREMHIRFLERSPAIRSAARFFRKLLIRLHAVDGEYVSCFYCGQSILATAAHLEHKRPISRGGDNRRSNLVLACAACNLAKARRTHEEFLRTRGSGAL